MDEGLVVAIGAPKILGEAVLVGLVGSFDIVDTDSAGTSSVVGLRIEFVRRGIVFTLPLVSRLVTTNPVVSGLVPDAEGGICMIAEDALIVVTS